MTQKEAVLKHLRTFKSITSMEAFHDYGVTRLSAVIFKLRQAGEDISSELVTERNRFGSPVTFARYHLLEKKDYNLYTDAEKEFE